MDVSEKLIDLKPCPFCGSKAFLCYTTDNWIKAEIKPLEEGKYYVITEMQKDTALYKKGDIVIDYDWYSKTLGWMSIKENDSTRKILAWAEILLPDAPEEIKDRLVTYFGVEVANRRDKNDKH